MLHRPLALTLVFLLTGCDVILERLDGLLTGRKSNTVVLASAPTVVGSATTSFVPKEPIEVVGADAAVCFVLKGNVSLQDQKAMQAAFEQATNGVALEVTLVQPSGVRLSMGRPFQAWRLSGKVLEREELSACVSAPCGAKLPLGKIGVVEMSANPSFPVQGIYWNSEQTLAEIANAEASANATSSPKSGGLQTSVAGCSRRG